MPWLCRTCCLEVLRLHQLVDLQDHLLSATRVAASLQGTGYFWRRGRASELVSGAAGGSG